MKTVHLTPQSLKQIKPISMEDNLSDIREDRESNYFPGCRKDANCNCKMCLDSITATLDLMSMSVQRSSLTKLSASKPELDKTPVSIDPTLLSTPASKTPPFVEVACSKTALRSTAKTVHPKNVEAKKMKLEFRRKYWRWVLLLGLILGLEFGFSWGVVRVLQPRLSEEILRDVVEESVGAENLSERLMLFQKHLNNSVDGKLSSCNLGDSNWKINQDGLILNSYCTLYKSAAEEVFIWGWPLQTVGLVTAGFSSRLFDVLCGQVKEWPEGKTIFVVQKANTRWILRRWSASAVQLEPNTWIIEYKRNYLLENPSILVAAVEFIEFTILKQILRMKQQFWLLLPDFKYYYTASPSEVVGVSIPT